jgi:hypothetical protein
MLEKCVSPSGTEVPIHRGVTFGFFARNGFYGSPQARLEVDRMFELGVTWVCVVTTVWQESYFSTRQFRDFKMTPSDNELIGIIEYIHSKGMKVQLRPMLQGWDGSFRMNVMFPWEDDPPIFLDKKVDYWTRWFDSLIERTLHYAGMAEATGCEAYGLDSELDRTTHERLNAHWKRVIAAARGVYSGHLTTGHTLEVNYLRELKERPDHWFRDLDSLGTSFYVPLGECPPSMREMYHLGAVQAPGPECAPDSPEMIQWLAGPRQYLAEVAEQLGKPFYFAECGIRSTSAGVLCGNASVANHDGRYDGQTQVFFLESVLNAFWNESWWMGMYWWKWDEHWDRPHYKTDPRGDQGMTIWGKPAADTMKRWYDRPERR